MTDHQNPAGSDPNTQSQREAWREVGRQFQTLGDSLANAFKAAWTDETNRQRVEEMRSGIESMINQVGRVLNDYSNSPEGQRIRSEAKRTAENLRTASEQTMAEARPHLVAALRQVNSELQRMIDNMETPTQPKSGAENPPGEDTTREA